MRICVRSALIISMMVSILTPPACAEQSHPPAIGWSRDGRQVAACGTRNASVFDATCGRIVRRVTLQAMPTGVALSPDGKLLAVGTLGSQVVLFDIGSGEQVRTMTGDKRFGGGFDLTFTADGRWLVTTGVSIGRPAPDPFVRVWDVASGAQVTSLPGPRGDVSPKGRWLVARNPVEERVVVQQVPGGNKRAYNAARLPYGPFREDDKRMALIDDTARQASYIDLPEGSAMTVLPIEDRTVADFGMSPDLLYLVTNRHDDDSDTDVITVVRLKDRWKTAELRGRSIRATTFSTRAVLAVEEPAEGRVRLISAQTGATTGLCRGGQYAGVHEYLQYGFSPDGRALGIVDTEMGGEGPSLRLFDGQTGKTLWTKSIDG